MHPFTFAFLVHIVFCLNRDTYDYANSDLLVGNIKRRDTIPFQSNNKIWQSDSLNYRKTKDIREVEVDRRFEITKKQLKEHQREAQFRNNEINDVRDEEIDSAQLLGDKYRNGMQIREDGWRIPEAADNQLGPNNYNWRNVLRRQHQIRQSR